MLISYVSERFESLHFRLKCHESEGPEDAGNKPQPPLDAVCILGEGVYLYIRPNNPMGILIGITPHDGSPKKVVDRAGCAFIPTEAPLAFTLSWLHSAMPRILRGRSVFAPYLIPNQKNLRYMVKHGHIQTATEASES